MVFSMDKAYLASRHLWLELVDHFLVHKIALFDVNSVNAGKTNSATGAKCGESQQKRQTESETRSRLQGRLSCCVTGWHHTPNHRLRGNTVTSQNVDLKRAGLKVTLPRLNILSILSESADEGAHLSAEDVYQRLRDAGDDVGLATVYRVLTQFETAGLVERHNFESGHSVFELATDDHHDHMVDVDTNEVIEFVDEEIEARQHAIAAERGFEIIDHSLVLYVRKKR